MDSSDRFLARDWPEGNPGGAAENAVAHTDWSGMEWKFKNFTISGTEDLDEYQQKLLYGSGQRTKMSDGSGSTLWSYDTRGQAIASHMHILLVGKEMAWEEPPINDYGRKQ